jgi:hypothetical protein
VGGTTGYVPPASINLPTFNNTYNRPTGLVPPTTATPNYGLRQPQGSYNTLPGTFQSGTPTNTFAPGTANPAFNQVPAPQPSAFDEFFGRD